MCENIDTYTWELIFGYLDQLSSIRLIQTCKLLYKLKDNISKITITSKMNHNDIIAYKNVHELIITDKSNKKSDYSQLHNIDSVKLMNYEQKIDVGYLTDYDAYVSNNYSNPEKLKFIENIKSLYRPYYKFYINFCKLKTLTTLDCSYFQSNSIEANNIGNIISLNCSGMYTALILHQ